MALVACGDRGARAGRGAGRGARGFAVGLRRARGPRARAPRGRSARRRARESRGPRFRGRRDGGGSARDGPRGRASASRASGLPARWCGRAADRGLAPVRVAVLPPRLDFASAASVAWPGLVARHCSCDVARVRTGERVLVVSAGGGVGLSLVGRARALGAEVYATASSPARRAALLEQGACVLEGEDAIGARMERNAESDQAAEVALRFDVIVSSRVGAGAARATRSRWRRGGVMSTCVRASASSAPSSARCASGSNRAYLPVDCLDCARLRREGHRRSPRRADDRASKRGPSRPIPLTRFPVSETARALRFMTQNRHTGRVVVDLAGADAVAIERACDHEAALVETRRFIVSGESGPGAGRCGASALADWLRAHGAAEVTRSTRSPAGRTPRTPRPMSGSTSRTNPFPAMTPCATAWRNRPPPIAS